MPTPQAPPPAKPPPVSIDDLRGAVRLLVDGVHGATRIAQGLHGTITGLAPPVGRRPERPARGLSGLAYGAVRAGSSLVGTGLDTALARLQAATASGREPSQRSAIVCALNGVLGDHLARTGNPLAIPMSLHVRGEPSPRLLVLLHGLCMGDQQWTRKGHDHGAELARALGATAVYARYNSGLHVSENGLELARQLEALVAGWPVPVDSLVIVGHSMGGLVARSAAHQAALAGQRWPRQLRRMVFLGTPHHGAALERGGNWLHAVLGASPYLAPFTRLGGVRSDGITDLRHGNLLASDWAGGRFEHRDTRTIVPLPGGVDCYAIAGELPGPAGSVLGDGLVSVDSAFGRHPLRTHGLRLPPSHTWVARGTHHLDLLSDPRVQRKLRQWLR